MFSLSYGEYFIGFWLATTFCIAIFSKTKKNLKWWAFIPVFLFAIIGGIHYISILMLGLIILILANIGLVLPIEINQFPGTFWWCSIISVTSFFGALRFEKSIHN